jgi:hypothetical protein
MNGNTVGNRGPRRLGVLVAVAALALLATAFRVHVQNSFSTGSGPAGSAAYRQEIAFAGCMRSHGVPNFPDPPPGDFISVQLTQNAVSQAVAACKRLAPGGRKNTNLQIRL